MKVTKISTVFFVILILLVTVGCSSKFKHNIDKLEKGITIHQDSLLIKVEVIDEAIIHVTKELVGNEKSTIPDYVTVLKPQNITWDLKETKDQIEISTAVLKCM